MSMVYLDPLRDMRDVAPVDECMRCRDGLFEYEAEPDEDGHIYCPECRALLDRLKREPCFCGKETEWH